jgi:hopene-associated glycosyltransferase HpnB
VNLAEHLWLLATVPGAVLWLIILLLPWRPWSTRERLESGPSSQPADLSNITVLIPARNEAEGIGRTLTALVRQGPGLEIVVINDQSEDDTAGAARAAGPAGMRVIEGETLPDGWTGKLWALEQSLTEVNTKYTLLLDADIEVLDGIVGRMFELLRARKKKMVSLMATLSMVGPWEKLLMPSFIYFFKLLYPFHLANSSSSRVAAAAGGTVLIETDVLREIGGFAALKDELIDDCALAAKVKAAGHGTWVGLSHSVVSHRRYPTLRSIWNMVARTAYTQLQYSPVLLLGCVLALLWTFVLPLAGLFAPDPTARAAAIVAGVTAAVTYLPTLIYYRRSPAWALLLPIIGALYLAMTVDSAYRFSKGIRSEWRGRVYATEEPDFSLVRSSDRRYPSSKP